MSLIVTREPVRGASWDASTGGNYQVKYRVESSDKTPIEPGWARNAVFEYASIDPNGSNAYVGLDGFVDNRSILVNVTKEDVCRNDSIMRIVCNYVFQPFGDINPLLQAPRVNYAVCPVGEIVVYRDVNGQPIVNRAGFPPASPCVVGKYNATISISRYMSFIPGYLAQYAGCVNLDYFTVRGVAVAPGQGLFVDVTSSDQGINANFGQINDVSINISVAPEGHKFTMLNSGMMVIGDSGKAERAVDENSEPCSEPVLMNGGGGKLPVGQPPIVLEFDVHQKVPFGSLFG